MSGLTQTAQARRRKRLYQSPPGSKGNDGALPTSYDSTWQTYTNLTPAQVQWFYSQPQFLSGKYLPTRRWHAEISGTTVTINGATVSLGTQDRDQNRISTLKQDLASGVLTTTTFRDLAGNWHQVDAAATAAIHATVAQFREQTYQLAAQLDAGIKAGTITSPQQIDAAYAVKFPNSLSAKIVTTGMKVKLSAS